jgi:hypothetical protein
VPSKTTRLAEIGGDSIQKRYSKLLITAFDLMGRPTCRQTAI